MVQGPDSSTGCSFMKIVKSKSGDSFIIREVSENDAEAILGIYSPYITGTSITFETEVPSPEEFRKRIRSVSEIYPWLVAEIDGSVAGYAYASRHRERAAYRWSVDFAVYIDPAFQGRGLGKMLYAGLIDIVKSLGYYNAFGIIALPNERSVQLHESAGFIKAGHISSAGYKLGNWHDTGYWQLRLREYDEFPAEPVPYKNLSKS